MSYERDTRHSGSGPGPSRTTQAASPGKATLTDGLTGGVVQRKATPGGEPGSTPSIGAESRSFIPAPQPAGRDLGPIRHVPDVDATKHDNGVPDAGISNPNNAAATVVGASADSEYAFDDSFTPALVAALHAHPNLSIEEVLLQLASGSLGEGTDNSGGLHHPTIVQYGQAAQATPGTGEPKKRAVLIANQNYVNINSLGTPIAEAGSMQSELASRGYDANVHSDKSSPDMNTLWGSLVSSANRGDDLVAFYGGHGALEGLVGIDHDFEPNPPDIFTNEQVSGVVNSATSKGAHIRFVMDSCHSGSAVQTIREERQNELAAVATSSGDQLRIAAMVGLRKAKEHLLALIGQVKQAPKEIEAAIQHVQAQAPDPANAEATRAWNQKLAKLRNVSAEVVEASDRAADRLWAQYVPLLNIVKTAVHHRESPPPITDYRTLGAQVNYLDDLWNAVSQPMERAAAKTGAAAPASK
jgi:Caspase domain